MALPQLQQDGVTPYTFPVERTADGPYRPIEPRQLTAETAAGGVKVVDLGQTEVIACRFEDVPTADVTALYAFFEDPLVRWGLHAVTWVDELGVAQAVRLWPPGQRFDAPELAPGLHEVAFELRVEG